MAPKMPFPPKKGDKSAPKKPMSPKPGKKC